jgi:AP-3 complex subunit beta
LTKIEVLNLAATLLTHCPGSKSIDMLTRHALALARYDQDWDVRDRARLLTGLLRSVRQSNGEAEDDEVDTGGVVLRSEQIKLVLSDCPDLRQGSDQSESRRLVLSNVWAIESKSCHSS